jgi:hypothetical protein
MNSVIKSIAGELKDEALRYIFIEKIGSILVVFDAIVKNLNRCNSQIIAKAT